MSWTLNVSAIGRELQCGRLILFPSQARRRCHDKCHNSEYSSMTNPEDDDINPFAVTSIPNPFLPIEMEQQLAPDQVYRYVDTLAVRRVDSVLPGLCVKSNEPATRSLKRVLYWHHPALYLLVIVSPLIYIIVSLIVRKKAVVYIPLAPRFFWARTRNMLIAWALVCIGFAMFIGGIGTASGSSTNLSATLIVIGLLGPIVSLAGFIFGIHGCRMIYSKHIDEHFAWLGGVSKDYIAPLPEWPYGKIW
jgi:hypothetical protein